MPGTQDLSFAFLESHPTDAARVLERVAPQGVAALLADAPARLVAPALRAMLPLHAARCLETLADDIVSGLLRAMGPQAGVAVLHYVPEARRAALLAQLPTPLAVAFHLLLGYPQDSVGAWMNPRVLALPEDTTAENVLRRLRESEGENDCSIFVISSAQQLLGRVDLPEVLRAGHDARLSGLMHKVVYTLPARSSILAVERHAGWDDRQLLPVVERENRFVGALDRGVLVRALLRRRPAGPGARYGDIAAVAANQYWLGVAGLIQAIVAMLPVARPQTNGGSSER
jgi:magnesium transporter